MLGAEDADTTWLARLGEVLRNRDHLDPDLVEIGKYNADQKGAFWLMSILIIITSSRAAW